jgi:hypothetical protein
LLSVFDDEIFCKDLFSTLYLRKSSDWDSGRLRKLARNEQGMKRKEGSED